jgi:hypothetical protein
MVEITGCPGILATFYFTFLGCKNIPDGEAFAVCVMATFYLKCGCGYAPFEIFSKGCLIQQAMRLTLLHKQQ